MSITKLYSDPYFTVLSADIGDKALPERFTFPFYYQPHPISLIAVAKLQKRLDNDKAWQQSLGLKNCVAGGKGKMFGVLVVKNQQGELGFLSAYSGAITDDSVGKDFVPPVFDILADVDFYTTEQKKINEINQEIESLSSTTELIDLNNEFLLTQQAFEQALTEQKVLMSTNRQRRKAQRLLIAEQSSLAVASQLKQLDQESISEKLTLRDLKAHWQKKLASVEASLTASLNEIGELKRDRKRLSAKLQRKIFKQFSFLNIAGHEKNLGQLFIDTPEQKPPAGAGSCAAPKLLQYAFLNDYLPICMAEFWWGTAPKSEIRQHGNFYPACSGKCQPILAHMLDGMTLDDNLMIVDDKSADKVVDIIYQDEHIAVINKPDELLSVPGKAISDCVYARMKMAFPKATGPLIVHRLDMSTSGLMVIALSKRANKQLQKQFIERKVNKCYVAILDGEVPVGEGTIDLPLMGDFHDKPRQKVCFEKGKKSETFWKIIEPSIAGKTRILLYPKTGRTHQLRVHCAHPQGLNTPMLGDDLYGKKANRLHLHAQRLAFQHPITREDVTFEVKAGF